MKPKFIAKEVVYRNRYQQVYRLELDFGVFRKEYFVADHGERVAVVVAGPEGILFTRQYRHIIDRLSWEVPGGKVDPGESREEAARRECAEETGMMCRQLTPLIHFQPGLDTLYNPTQVYHCSDFEPIPGHQPLPQEVSTCAWVPLDRCIAMIAGGEIVDSLSVISVLAYDTLVFRRQGNG